MGDCNEITLILLPHLATVHRWIPSLTPLVGDDKVVLRTSMSLGDPSPSPERGPQRFKNGPGRPQLEVRALDPLAIRLDVDNLNRFTDVLHLCGLVPTESGVEYLWKATLRNQLPNIDGFLEAQGALGLNSELDISIKHELECRGHHVPELREYDDKVSFTLSTRHREGSEFIALQNLSAESPALDGLCLEIIASPYGDTSAVAHIFWNEESLSRGNPGERWELIRGFYHHFNHRDLPETAPVAAGQGEKFHYMSIDLDPMAVKVQRLDRDLQNKGQNPGTADSSRQGARPFELTLRQPSVDALEKILALGGALQIQSPWMEDTGLRTVLTHLISNLKATSKLDIDTLKMCDNALPCVIFSKEESCDGAAFPPSARSKVVMSDYTCRNGDLRLQLMRCDDVDTFEAALSWDASPHRFSESVWNEIKRVAEPFLG